MGERGGQSFLAAGLFVGAAAGVILLATLIPELRSSGGEFPRSALEARCLDFVRNVALFAPLGAALAWLRVRFGIAMAIGAGLTLSVEIAQLLLPGRVASAYDLASNTLGTAVGFAALRVLPGWIAPDPARERRLVLGAGAAVTAALLLSGWLFAPAFGSELWRGLFRPRLAWYRVQYGGELQSSRLEGIELPRKQYSDLSALAPSFRGDFTLRLELVAGEPPPARAPLFLVVSEGQNHLLEFAALGEHLVFQIRSRGKVVGFEPTQFWFLDALGGVQPGAALPLALERRGDLTCVALAEAKPCDGHTLGDGWQLFLPTTPSLARHRSGLGALWLALLCVPLGYWGRRDAATAGAWALVAAALVAVPLATVLLPTPPLQALGAAAGGFAGAGLRGAFRRS